jgi:hypothetical protein
MFMHMWINENNLIYYFELLNRVFLISNVIKNEV